MIVVPGIHPVATQSQSLGLSMSSYPLIPIRNSYEWLALHTINVMKFYIRMLCIKNTLNTSISSCLVIYQSLTQQSTNYIEPHKSCTTPTGMTCQQLVMTVGSPTLIKSRHFSFCTRQTVTTVSTQGLGHRSQEPVKKKSTSIQFSYVTKNYTLPSIPANIICQCRYQNIYIRRPSGITTNLAAASGGASSSRYWMQYHSSMLHHKNNYSYLSDQLSTSREGQTHYRISYL